MRAVAPARRDRCGSSARDLQGTARGIAQDDGIGLEMRGDTGVVDAIDAGLQAEGHMLARDKEILVVDGKRRAAGA